MTAALLRNRFVRFLVVGGVNTVFGYSVYAALILLGLHYSVAALLSTIAGVLFNFKTTGTFVFGGAPAALLWKFVAVYGINYVVGVALLRVSVQSGVPAIWAGAIWALPLAALAFALNRAFVFRSPSPA